MILYEMDPDKKTTKPTHKELQVCPSRACCGAETARCCVTWDTETEAWVCIFCHSGYKKEDDNA